MSNDEVASWRALASDLKLDHCTLEWAQGVMRNWHDPINYQGLASTLSQAGLWEPDVAAEFARRARELRLPDEK
jgi:hypothetical protein